MKGERTFILRSDAIRNAATSFIGDSPISEPPLEVIVRKHQDKRSRDQNALYWAWLHVIGDELGYSAEEAHEAFKAHFLPHKNIQIGGGRSYYVPASTSSLPVADFAQYMDKVAAWAANQGIRLPTQV